MLIDYAKARNEWLIQHSIFRPIRRPTLQREALGFRDGNDPSIPESAPDFEDFSYTTFPADSGLLGVVHRPGGYQESAFRARE